MSAGTSAPGGTPDLAATDPFTPEGRRIAVVSGGLGDPSQTRMLADRLAEAAAAALADRGVTAQIHVVSLRELASDIAQALVTTARSEALAAALREVETADAVVAVSPTFKASYAGLFKSFFDLVEDSTLIGVPVLLGATGGTARHSLMIDTAMRPLFSYLKARIVPTAVFAASDDWGLAQGQGESTRTSPLSGRVRAAGADLADILLARPARVRPASATPGPPAAGDADHGRADAASTDLPDLEVTPFDQLLHPDS